MTDPEADTKQPCWYKESPKSSTAIFFSCYVIPYIAACKTRTRGAFTQTNREDPKYELLKEGQQQYTYSIRWALTQGINVHRLMAAVFRTGLWTSVMVALLRLPQSLTPEGPKWLVITAILQRGEDWSTSILLTNFIKGLPIPKTHYKYWNTTPCQDVNKNCEPKGEISKNTSTEANWDDAY